MKRVALVLSDLHFGTGHRRGRINIYDDFREDDRLCQLIEKYSNLVDTEVHLVLNGDIFDLLKVPISGHFPDAITERLAKLKLTRCLRGHPKVVAALKQFLSVERNRVTYQPGNHDMELFFPGVQRVFTQAIAGADVHPRVQFVSDAASFSIDGVEFHHGHQFEALHAFDFRRLTLPRPDREPILNLPWGSLFILHVLYPLLRERPSIDKVHPFWPLVVGGLIFDTRFTVRMVWRCIAAFVRARFNPQWWQKRPFEKVTKFLRNEIGFLEHLDRNAQRILKSNPQTKVVVMGHTHVPMVRTFPKGRMYLNTGSWVPMVDLSLGRLGQHLELHYALIEWDEEGPMASLHRWHGRKPESEEVIS